MDQSGQKQKKTSPYLDECMKVSNVMFTWFKNHLSDEKSDRWWNDAATAFQTAADQTVTAHEFAVRYGIFLMGELNEYAKLH